MERRRNGKEGGTVDGLSKEDQGISKGKEETTESTWYFF